MTDREKVIKGLEYHLKEINIGKTCCECPYFGDNPCEIQLIANALELLKEQEENDSEWLEDSDPGQEYGTTWACRVCGHSLHMPYIWNPYKVNWKFCPWCGARMAVKMDD